MTDPKLVAFTQARLTAKALVGGQQRYAWKEQIAELTGDSFSDTVGGAYGTTTVNYAVELNNLDVDITGLPKIVHLRQRGLQNGQMVWEFNAGLPTDTSGFVSGSGTLNHVVLWDVAPGTIKNSEGTLLDGVLTVYKIAAYTAATPYVRVRTDPPTVPIPHIWNAAVNLVPYDPSATNHQGIVQFAYNDSANSLDVTLGDANFGSVGSGVRLFGSLTAGVYGAQWAFGSGDQSVAALFFRIPVASFLESTAVPGAACINNQYGLVLEGTSPAYQVVVASTLRTGVTGTLGPGSKVAGGIVYDVGSGSFVSLSTANTWTAAQTITPATDVVPLTLRGSGAGTADLLDFKNAAGAALTHFDAAGNFSGNSATATTASTATALATPRTINGTAFDGTANITVTAAAGTLTGTTLNPTVVTSSLTSVGTLTGGQTGAGFTIALTTSTVTGTLPAARLPAFGSGDVSFAAGGGAGTIANAAVTLAKIANAAASSKLVGSGAAGSGASYAEITLGSGLTMTGTTLSATSSGGTVTSVASADGSATITNPTTTPDIAVNPEWMVGSALINGQIKVTVASNAMTVAIKNLAGNDPSAADPVSLVFYSTAGGADVIFTLTAATSFTVSSGSSLGALNATAFRVWFVAFNDGGTLRLGAINVLSSTNIFKLRDGFTASSTAEGGAGAADLAQTFYTGTAVTTKRYRVLGYANWPTGLTTAGTWASAPSDYFTYTPGSPLPGDTIQTVRTNYGAVATGTTTIPVDNTTPLVTEGDQYMSQQITAYNECNVIRVRAQGHLSNSTGANHLAMTLFSSIVSGCLATAWATQVTAAYLQQVQLSYERLSSTITSESFTVRAGYNAAGTTTFNGVSSAGFYNGTINSYIEAEEVMA